MSEVHSGPLLLSCSFVFPSPSSLFSSRVRHLTKIFSHGRELGSFFPGLGEFRAHFSPLFLQCSPGCPSTPPPRTLCVKGGRRGGREGEEKEGGQEDNFTVGNKGGRGRRKSFSGGLHTTCWRKRASKGACQKGGESLADLFDLCREGCELLGI